MSQQRYPVLWIGKVAVVSLPVEIDVTNADAIREELLSVVNQGADLLVADMTKTTFCDSAGIGALVRTFKRASASGSGMRLAIGMPAVQRVLAITGIDTLMKIYPSVAASLAHPPGQNAQNATSSPADATAKAETDGDGT